MAATKKAKPIPLTPYGDDTDLEIYDSRGHTVETIPAGRHLVFVSGKPYSLPFARLVGVASSNSEHGVGYFSMTPDETLTPQSPLYDVPLGGATAGVACLLWRGRNHDLSWLHRLLNSHWYNCSTDGFHGDRLDYLPNKILDRGMVNYNRFADLTLEDVNEFHWERVRRTDTISDRFPPDPS